MDGSADNLDDEAEAEEERPLSVLWERCIQQSIIVDLSDNDSLHLSDLQPGSFTICLNQDSPASDASLNINENSELDSSTEVEDEATESSVTSTSGESESGSSGIRHSGTHVSQPVGQTPANLKEKRVWRYEDDPANTSDEDQEDLPYDDDLLASQCLPGSPRGETSEKQEKAVHSNECKNTDRKAATDFNSLCALNLKGETGRAVAKLPNPQAAAAAVTAVAPSKDADAAPCISGEEQAALQGLPGEAAATSKQPQHARAGTAISDLLLRHFTREELQNATELIDAETLPEVSLMESLDDTVVSLVSQHILRHGPADCGHSARGKHSSHCEAEEEVEEAEVESGDDRTVLSERVGEVSVNSQRAPGTQRQPSLEEEHCSARSQSPSSSPQPAKEEEDSPQRPPLVRTRSFTDLKYGQGQVHYRLPDFSKVAPKVKIPKSSGGSRSVCPSPGIQRVQSSPSVLAKSSASHVATMAVISRVLEDIIQPNDRAFLFRDQEWDQGPAPQLQVEYDNLVAISAEADNLVDRMVQGDNFNVVSEPSLNTGETDKKEVKGVRRDSCEMRATEQSTQPSLTGPDEDLAKAPEPTTAPPLDKTKEQSEGDKMTRDLMEIVCQFGQKVAEFKNGVSAMCTNVEEQQMVFKGMMDAQDQLERNYMAKKEEHRALERQNYMGIAKNTGHFDPDRQVEGEIFRIGMLLEDVKEQIDANVYQSFSPPLSTSTPVPPPHQHQHQHQHHRLSPQPPLPEDLMPGYSMSADGRLEEEEGSGGQTETDYRVDLTGDHSISLQYSDTSLERRETTHASSAGEEDEEEERQRAPAEDEDTCIPVLASSLSSEAKDRLWDTGSPGWRNPVKTVCTFSGRPLGGALSSSNESAGDPLDHGLCSVQKTRSPEIDSGLGSTDRSRSASGQSQPQSHTERLQLLSGPGTGSPLTTSSDSEVSTSHLTTTVAMATSATLLRPQPLRITAGDQWLRGGQQDRSITRQDQEGGAFSPEQLSPFSREGRPSSFSRVPSRVSTHSLPPSETQPHVCTCHSEALLALQCEVAHLRRALEERLSHLPHYPQPSSRPKQERRCRTRPKPQHRPSSSRGTKSNPGSLKVDDWISSDMDRSKSKDSRSSELSGSLQKSLSSTSGFLSPQRKSQISSPTVSGDRQWSPDLPLSSSTRDASLRQDHCPSYLQPDEGVKDVYARNRDLALSRQPLSRPSLQLNYDSSCSLPASFKVLEGQSSSTPYQRRRSTQSDSALLPSNGYLPRSSLSSPRPRGSRTKHRTSKEEDISRTLDKAIEAARSMKRTTERMAQSLSADLAKAELQRKLSGLHTSLPSERRPNADS